MFILIHPLVMILGYCMPVFKTNIDFIFMCLLACLHDPVCLFAHEQASSPWKPISLCLPLALCFPFRLQTTLFAPIPSFHYVPALFNPPTTPLIYIYNFNLYFPLHCCAIGVFTTSLRYLSPILTLQV